MPAKRRLILIIVILFLLLLFLVVPGVSWSQTPQNPWADPARELAKKIAVIAAPRQNLTLTVRNISSLSDSEVAAVREALEAALRIAGLGVAGKSNTALALRITLSENLQGLLWVVEVQEGETREVAITVASRARTEQVLPAGFQMTLRKQFIIDSEKPILDFLLTSPAAFGQGELLTLDTQSLTLFSSKDQKWMLQQATPIPATIAWPRDPRGRLERNEPSIAVYLPGVKCDGVTWQSLRLQCNRAVEPDNLWNLSGAGEGLIPARMNIMRNFFEGSLPISPTAVTRVTPFYSLAEMDGAAHLWILIGTDQKLHIFSERNYSGDLKPAGEQSGWGSELASVRSSCGRHEQLLLTGAGDWTEPGMIQAYEIVDGKAVAVSSPVEFPGPITALWPGDIADFANAIVRNLKTGRYEAYTLTLTCGR